jgi:hypothetical protein
MKIAAGNQAISVIMMYNEFLGPELQREYQKLKYTQQFHICY